MKVLRDPLFHFLLLGAGLFALFELIGGSTSDRTDEIVITPGLTRHIAEVWQKTWQRPPTPEELELLIEEHVKEEVFVREALAMELDRDDTIVRRRLRQKLEFLLDDLADAAEPADDELRQYFTEHSNEFRVPAPVKFRHVFLDPGRRGDRAPNDAMDLLERLRGESVEADISNYGDPLLLESDVELAPIDEVARRFGGEFAGRLSELPVGRWAGPVESGYGLHLVYIRERIDGELPGFQTVRDAVRREFEFERRQRSSEAIYDQLRKKYSVVRIEEPPANGQEVTKAGLLP